jgi:hypothetical protein
MHVGGTRRTRELHASLLVCRDTRSDQRAHAHSLADVSRRCDSGRGTSARAGEGVHGYSRGLHQRCWRAVGSCGVLGGYSWVLVVPLGDYSARLRRHGRGAAQGVTCGAVVRRRVRGRCRRQQRVPGGLRADRDRGGVPHRGGRRGQDREYVVRVYRD